MPLVSVIASIHHDLGRADASSMLAILEGLGPEVVFLEQPAPGFETFCSGTRTDLESRAVCRYRHAHHVTLVPVDLPIPPPFSRSDIDALYDAIEAQSPDYLRLVREKDEQTARYGFAFLNSPECSTLWPQIYVAELSAVEALGSAELREVYRLWRNTHERREEGMMANIEGYCSNNPFERGVFVVGSAHRHSVYHKSMDRSKTGSSALNWVFPGLDPSGAA